MGRGKTGGGPNAQSQANILVTRMNFLVRVMALRCVQNIIENPHGSVLFEYPPLQRTLVDLSFYATMAHMCRWGT